MGAFDLTRPPEPSLIEDCVHCGFCLPTCPTYVLWGEEMDSPRGRILLMRSAHEGGPDLMASQVEAWDNCLGCMACVTACPSGVQYHKLIEDTRGQIERNWERSRADRVWRQALFALFPHPGRLRALAPLAALQSALPTDRMVRRFPRLRELTRVAPRTSVRAAWRRLPERTPARGPRRGTVGFLQGCVQRVFFAHVNVATVGVLAAEGFEVFAPRLPRCCGALQLHTGYDDEARTLARATITAFEGCETVVVNAAGCGSAMKDYGHLFRDDPAWADRAAAFSAKVRDVTELLAEHDPVAPRHPVALTVAYHDACHLAHAQGVREAPRRLLRTIPGLELREPSGWEICCGSAGVYNLLKPDAAAELGRRKAEHLLDTGAQAVAAANPGCALQIAAHARALGGELPVHHPMELLHASIQGRTP
ncbi:MAG: glycolate oxidase iron-sulfur subunit [Baekduia sp.]|nr:glycolate oxidase iron-sulfur subunit [Baekduia sp.]